MKCSQEKKKFFKKILRQVRQSTPSQWYSTLKRISNHEQEKSKPLQVAEICHLTDKEQVEAIATAFNSISSQYQQVSKEDIQIPDIPAGSIPVITPKQVKNHMEKLKINKASVPDDIPTKILKEFSEELCVPLADVINNSFKTGTWPDSYKQEVITPAGKVSPVETMD